jgi:hypothetical protein
VKVCIIGNSNIAAVKDAWDHAASLELYDVQADFFGAGAPQWKSIEVHDGKLWANSAIVEARFSGQQYGRDHIDLTGYDAIFLHGFLRPRPLYQINEELAIHARETSHALSSALLQDLAVDMIANSVWARISRGIAENGHAPMVTSVRQYPSSTIIDKGANRSRYALCRDFSSKEDIAFISTFVAEVETQCRAAGHVVLSQPRETIRDRFFTDPTYCVGSRRISSDQQHKVNDYWHANRKYGELVVRQYLKFLKEL